MPELQITQEYLGFSIISCFWRPCGVSFSTPTPAKGRGSSVTKVIDGQSVQSAFDRDRRVANTGDDRNWTGHQFLTGKLVCVWPAGLGPDLAARLLPNG